VEEIVGLTTIEFVFAPVFQVKLVAELVAVNVTVCPEHKVALFTETDIAEPTSTDAVVTPVQFPFSPMIV
jgi:hypothetical protein